MNSQPRMASPGEEVQIRGQPISVRTDAKSGNHARTEVKFKHQRLSKSEKGSGSRQDYAELNRRASLRTEGKYL